VATFFAIKARHEWLAYCIGGRFLGRSNSGTVSLSGGYKVSRNGA